MGGWPIREGIAQRMLQQCTLPSRFQFFTQMWSSIWRIRIQADAGITMREYVAYIHDPDTTLTFDLRVFDMFSCPHYMAEYCRYGVKYYPINQSFNPAHNIFALTLAYYIWHSDDVLLKSKRSVLFRIYLVSYDVEAQLED